MISTPRLELIPITFEDGEKIVEWRNNENTLKYMFSSKKITLEQHLKWFENYLNSDTRMEFIINIRESKSRIGTIGLSNIDREHKKAEYGILIGERAFEGKGYAYEASTALISYCFKNMCFNKVYLRVFNDNSRALELYKKIGFSKEGVLRDDIFKDGIFRNILVMSILRKEWKD